MQNICKGYCKMHALQDLSLQLEKNKFENNLKVDAVASYWNIDAILSIIAMVCLNGMKN